MAESIGFVIGTIIGVFVIGFIGFKVIQIIYLAIGGIFRFIRFQTMTPEQKKEAVYKRKKYKRTASRSDTGGGNWFWSSSDSGYDGGGDSGGGDGGGGGD
ncbi:hypothetical protein FS935_19325 [Metabacillus litoralis]|uniref:Uncharacterized protein n=1 Tax=Metabacillus litoralis TaxID=152268 RepID=A0A5C6VR03_9BACI|nr:hypothetical protein [Metabacillus litoralis]TXC85808.1 hypothetical protein FS935_19325 [Metabacillus litoralis]